MKSKTHKSRTTSEIMRSARLAVEALLPFRMMDGVPLVFDSAKDDFYLARFQGQKLGYVLKDCGSYFRAIVTRDPAEAVFEAFVSGKPVRAQKTASSSFGVRRLQGHIDRETLSFISNDGREIKYASFRDFNIL